MADFKVSGEAEISPDHIVENVDEIIRKLDEFSEKVDELDEKLDNLSRKNVAIDIVLNGMDKLDELKLFLDDLDSKEYIVRVVVGDIIGNDKLDALHLELDEMSAKDYHVGVKVNVDGIIRARTEMDALTKSLDRNTSSARSSSDAADKFAFSWRLLLPLLIPAAGALAITAGAALAVGSAFIAMAGPVAAVGLATKSAYTELTTFAGTLSGPVTTALSQAGDNYGQLRKILEDNSSAFRKMNRDMQDAVTEYFALKNALSAFEKAVEPETMGILVLGMISLQEILKAITPLAINAGIALEDLLADFANRLQDPVFQKFFSDVNKDIYTLVTDWGEGVINIIEGIVAIADAFLPLSMNVSGGFLHMTESFDNWAQHLAQSPGFKKFVQEVETDGPILLDLLGQIVLFVGHLFSALNNSGQVGGFLTTIDRLVRAANSFMTAHPQLVQFAVDLLLIFGAASKLVPLITPLITLFSSPVGIVVAGVAGLAVAFYAAYTNSKKFRDYVNTNLLPTLKGIEGDLKQVKQWFISIWPDIEAAWKKYGGNIESIVTGDFKGIGQIIQGAIEVIEGIIEIGLGLLTGNWHQVWDGITKITGGFWKIIEGTVKGSLNTIKNLAEMYWKQISTDVSTAWDGIYRTVKNWSGQILLAVEQIFSNIVTQAGSGMGRFLSAIVTYGTNIKNWFQALPGDIINWLGNMGSLLYNAGRDVMNGFLNGLRSMWNDVTGFFGNLTSIIPDLKGPPEKDKNLLTDNGSLIMQSLINGFESKYAAVENSLQNFTKTIGGTFGSQFEKDISAQINTSVGNVAANVEKPLGSGGNIAGSGTSSITIASGAITVYNPTPESAGTTLTRVLQGTARWGIIQTPTGFDSKAAG